MPDPDPRDALWEGIAALGAIYALLLHGARPQNGQLHLVDAEQLCVLVRMVQERLEEAQEGFRTFRPS